MCDDRTYDTACVTIHSMYRLCLGFYSYRDVIVEIYVGQPRSAQPQLSAHYWRRKTVFTSRPSYMLSIQLAAVQPLF